MLRDLLLLVLVMLIARAVWRVIGGVVQGLSRPAPPARGGRGGRAPTRGVQMERDPVCGTYVVPARAVALTDGTRQLFFCSAKCRDTFRARPRTGRPDAAQGRTA